MAFPPLPEISLIRRKWLAKGYTIRWMRKMTVRFEKAREVLIAGEIAGFAQ